MKNQTKKVLQKTGVILAMVALELCSCSIRDCISRNVRVACNRSRRCVTAAGTRAGTCA